MGFDCRSCCCSIPTYILSRLNKNLLLPPQSLYYFSSQYSTLTFPSSSSYPSIQQFEKESLKANQKAVLGPNGRPPRRTLLDCIAQIRQKARDGQSQRLRKDDIRPANGTHPRHVVQDMNALKDSLAKLLDLNVAGRNAVVHGSTRLLAGFSQVVTKNNNDGNQVRLGLPLACLALTLVKMFPKPRAWPDGAPQGRFKVRTWERIGWEMRTPRARPRTSNASTSRITHHISQNTKLLNDKV